MRFARARLLLYGLLAILVLLASAPAFADVVNLPSWFNQANARRHFTFNGTSPFEDYTAPWGQGFPAMMVSNPSSNHWLYQLFLDNSANQSNQKNVWLQFTWLESGTGSITDPLNGAMHGSTGTWSSPSSVDEDLGSGYHRRTITWTIFPQPDSEWFQWQTTGDWKVTEIAISTVCTYVPEPSSLATLLASGLFTAVFALRRRKH